MSKSNKAAKSALLLIIFTMGSKVLGFLREMLIANKFGSGMKTDTFFIALSAATLIGEFLRSSVSTTFIPVISEIEAKEGRQGKIKHTNNLINVILLISLILVILATVGTPLIIRIMASGFKGEQFNLAVKLTRIGLPIIIINGLIGVLLGYLQSEEKFNTTAVIGFPVNFVYIFYLLFLSSRFGIVGLMAASVIAYFSQVLIQVPELRKGGFRYKAIFDLKDKYIKKILYLSLPVILGSTINDINVIIDKTLASGLVDGSISALNYANRLNTLILSVFVTAITTVVFPLLAKEFSKDNIDGVKKIMGYGVNLILIITIPATVGLIILARPIVEVAFQRGAFTANDTLMTTSALVFYSIGLVASSMRLIITRVYYSLQDTKTPMINAAISVGINIVLNLILIQFMAHAGLALATSISTSISVLLMFIGLKKKIGPIGIKSYLNTITKTGLASLIMGIVAYSSYHGLYRNLGTSTLNNFISLGLSVALSILIYLILCYIFKVEEIKDLKNKIISKLKKR